MKHATITEATLLGDSSLSSAATARGRPLHKILAAFSAAYFAGALITDLVYWQIPDVLWERFSIWLILAGLVMAGLTVVAYAIDLASSRRIDRPAWPRVVGYALTIVLSLMNAFIHSRDGYTAVAPTGLALSAAVTLILIVVGWRGWSLFDHSATD